MKYIFNITNNNNKNTNVLEIRARFLNLVPKLYSILNFENGYYLYFILKDIIDQTIIDLPNVESYAKIKPISIDLDKIDRKYYIDINYILSFKN